MITQPQNDIALPQEVQDAVEKARNNVTVLQGEAARLDKLVRERNKEIVTLAERESFLEERVAMHDIDVKKLKAEEEQAKAGKDMLVAENAKIQKENEEMKAEMVTKQNELYERERAVAANEVEQQNTGHEQKARADELNVKERALDNATENLRGAVDAARSNL